MIDMDFLLPIFTTFGGRHGRGRIFLKFSLALLILRTTSCGAVDPPVILEEGTEKTVSEGQTLMLSCHGEMQLKWSHSKLNLTANEKVQSTFTERNTTKFGDMRKYSSKLIFVNIQERDSGVFFCQYEEPSLSSYNDNIYINVIKDSKEALPVKRGFFTLPKIIAIVIVGLLVVVTILLVLLHRNKNKLRDFRDRMRENTTDELKELDHLRLDRQSNYYNKRGTDSPELIDLSEETELLPLHSSWEFPRDHLKLGPQLGSGAFGRVMKAEATGLLEDDPVKGSTVAVKMLKPNADEAQLRALVCELKIMANLGRHINVVNLIGYSSKGGAINNDLYVIVEFCTRGNLLSYIRRNNKYFVNQLTITGSKEAIDASTTQPERNTSFHTAPTAIDNINYTATAGSSSSGNDSSSSGRNSNPYPLPSAGLTSVQSFRFDYQQEGPQTITTTDLLCWAFQIARGMEYLVSRKVIHGDLAARNVLLTDNNVVKICDFGLSKEMYKDYNYIMSTTGGKFPIKWMAIEAIHYGELSAMSDSWSFGVVLWELFSLGKMPYPGIKADQELIKRIGEGFRMEKPEYAPTPIYDIMKECWVLESERRPTFSSLVDDIGSILEGDLREHYVHLNTEYVRKNPYQIARRETKGKCDTTVKSEANENLPEADSSGYLPPIRLNSTASSLQVPIKLQNRSTSKTPTPDNTDNERRDASVVSPLLDETSI